MPHWCLNSKEFQFIYKTILDAILHNISDLGLWNSKLIFFRINFLSVATFFFFEIMVIYLHLKHVSFGFSMITNYISSFQNRISNPCSSTSLYFHSKLVKGNWEMWNCYVLLLWNYWVFLKMYIFEVSTFYLA